MMVRDEAHVIVRALRSVRDHIDHWVICDTGSVDETPVLILRTLAGIPGELHRVPWVNFGTNRTQAIRLAAGKADYILVMDADMTVRVHAPFRHALWADAYEITYEGEIDYTQPMLVADGHDWHYIGVVHEYLRADTARTWRRLPELTLVHAADGAHRADKFERDIRLLTAELEHNRDDPRTIFYLAQSYRDIGDTASALGWYSRRATLAGWDEERWYAGYQVARMRHLLGHPWPEVQAAYIDAYTARPTRLEPLYWLAKQHREAEQYAAGLLFAAASGPNPAYPASDRLFIDRAIYRYLLPLEYGVCAFGCGRINEAATAFERVLEAADVPDWVQESAGRGLAMARTGVPELVA
jgi:glycosyltransferase involved in cell wall biosynthesis